MALTDNLKAVYEYNSGALTTDTLGTYTLTNNGTVGESASGKIGYAADFGSTNSSKWFNRTPTPLSYTDLGTAWTVNVWVKCQDHSAIGRIMRYILNNGSLERNFQLDVGTDGKVAGTVFYGSAKGITGTTVLNTTDWYMVTFLYDGSSTKLYINGSNEATSTSFSWTGYSRNTFSNMTWGCEQLTNGGATSTYFKGLHDEGYIWNRGLSATEISTLYNSGAGLQYPFNASNIKSIDGLAKASVKDVNGLAIASVKTYDGLS